MSIYFRILLLGEPHPPSQLVPKHCCLWWKSFLEPKCIFQSVIIQSVFLQNVPDLRVFYALQVYLRSTHWMPRGRQAELLAGICICNCICNCVSVCICMNMSHLGFDFRNWKVEGVLFLWVSGSVVIFNLCYWNIYWSISRLPCHVSCVWNTNQSSTFKIKTMSKVHIDR